MRKSKLLSACAIVGFICTASCVNQPQPVQELSAEDANLILAVNEGYRTGWLNSDSAAVLNLFLADATIIPSGMTPKTGRKALQQFWFPDDSSETIVHQYLIDVLDLKGSPDLAFTTEKGFLSFSYRKGTFSMSKEVTAHALTVYRRLKDGEWKIQTRMWNDIR